MAWATLLLAFFLGLGPAPTSAEARVAPLLVLKTIIPLQGVSGRIDHMALDPRRNRLFVAEFGNNSVDVVNLTAGRPIHRITGLNEPQGVGYVAGQDLLFVANGGDGSVRMFRGDNFLPVGSIALDNDADNVRINPRNGTVVVGYGQGGLAVIDPQRHTRIGDIRLPAHPEGFQIDPLTNRAFVNLPDAREIAVVDLNAFVLSGTWALTEARANFPMALDTGSDRLAVVFRSPPSLVLFDRRSGKPQSQAATCGDADDVFFDGKRARLYISCGSGVIAVFQISGNDLRPLISIETSPGARTSLFVPERDRLYVARSAAMHGMEPAILAYQPSP